MEAPVRCSFIFHVAWRIVILFIPVMFSGRKKLRLDYWSALGAVPGYQCPLLYFSHNFNGVWRSQSSANGLFAFLTTLWQSLTPRWRNWGGNRGMYDKTGPDDDPPPCPPPSFLFFPSVTRKAGEAFDIKLNRIPKGPHDGVLTLCVVRVRVDRYERCPQKVYTGVINSFSSE